MVEIKGSVLNDSIKAVKTHFGDQAYDTIVGLLKGDTRALFEHASILATKWYPLDAFVEFLEMDIKVTAQGNEQELIKRSEAICEQQLRGIYKVFIRLGTPQFVLNRLSIVHQTYFRGVDATVTLQSTANASVKYTGFSKQHRLIGFSIIGFYRKSLEISGAKNITAKFATSIEDNKGYCELILNWSGK
jgi:hypothetical protein